MGTKRLDYGENDLIAAELKSYIDKAKIFIKEENELAKLEAKKTGATLVDKYADPLKFGKQHERSFKYVLRKVREIYSVPATSAYVERHFSKTGNIMRPNRRRLNDKLCEYLFFLKGNDNFDKFKI